MSRDYVPHIGDTLLMPYNGFDYVIYKIRDNAVGLVNFRLKEKLTIPNNLFKEMCVLKVEGITDLTNFTEVVDNNPNTKYIKTDCGYKQSDRE